MAEDRKEAEMRNQSQQQSAGQELPPLNLHIAPKTGQVPSIALRNPAPNSSPSSMPTGVCMVVSRRDPK